jgi:hypothetical protein
VLGRVVADGKQVAPAIVEKIAVHAREPRALHGQALDPRDPIGRRTARRFARGELAQRRDRARIAGGQVREVLLQEPALPPEGIDPESRIARGRVGDGCRDPDDAGLDPLEPMPREGDRRRAGIVGGLQVAAKAIDGFRPPRCRAPRPACAPYRRGPRTTGDPGSFRRRARRGPSAASSGGPRGCRCPRSTHTGARAALATACRTS